MDAARPITDLSVEERDEVLRLVSELDQFVEKRAEKAKDQARVEGLWQESVRVDREKRQNKVAEEWFDYHDRLIKSHEDTLGGLLHYHRRERARYARLLGLPEVGTEGQEKEEPMNEKNGHDTGEAAIADNKERRNEMSKKGEE